MAVPPYLLSLKTGSERQQRPWLLVIWPGAQPGAKFFGGHWACTIKTLCIRHAELLAKHQRWIVFYTFRNNPQVHQ
jgi:hypothetical protein